MAFWALETFNKIKGISIKDATNKIKGYVVPTPPLSKSTPTSPNLNPIANSHNHYQPNH